MSLLMMIRHNLPTQNRGICNTKTAVVTTSHATEVFARVAPVASGTSKRQCGRQAEVVYDSLSELLSKHHATPADVVTERFFFRDLARDWDDFRQVRDEYYRRRGLTGRWLPSLSCVGQPPWRSGQDLELLVYAVKPLGGIAHVESLRGLGLFLQQQNLASWPATAIQGGCPHPPEARDGMDVHALLNPEVAKIEPMCVPGANGASPSASSARGLKVVLPEQTCLFISAAVTTVDGHRPVQETLGPSIERMIAEVRALFEAHGAHLTHLAQVVTRLKPSVSAEQYEQLCIDLTGVDTPHAVVQAGLGRPELLAELELTAVVPSK